MTELYHLKKEVIGFWPASLLILYLSFYDQGFIMWDDHRREIAYLWSSAVNILFQGQASKQTFSSFDDMLQNCGVPVLVDFYAVWYVSFLRYSSFFIKWMFTELGYNLWNLGASLVGLIPHSRSGNAPVLLYFNRSPWRSKHGQKTCIPFFWSPLFRAKSW